jgi:hypothetical protein
MSTADDEGAVALYAEQIAILKRCSVRTARRLLSGLHAQFGDDVVEGRPWGGGVRYWTTLSALEAVEMPSLRKGNKDPFARLYALENEVGRLKEIVAKLQSAATRGQPVQNASLG